MLNLKYAFYKMDIYQAVKTGNLEELQKQVAHINDVDDEGGSPLHYAVLYGQLECARFLLESGANVMSTDNNGNTPLHYSANNCWSLLLEYGANIYVKNNEDMSLLHCVAAKNDTLQFLNTCDKEVCAKNDNLEFLISHNLGIDDQDNEGNTPLHFAADGYVHNVQSLLDHKANINSINVRGETPCHIAVYGGHVECLRILLSYHPNLAGTDWVGTNVIHSAAQNGNASCLRLLLDFDRSLIDALTNADCECNLQFRERCGSSTTNTSQTALILALNNGHKECAEILLDYGANINSGPINVLYTAARMGKIDDVRWLLEKGANANVKNSNGERPYHGQHSMGMQNVQAKPAR